MALINLNAKTGEPVSSPAIESHARCLAVLLACAAAMEGILADAEAGRMTEAPVLGLLLTLNATCQGDGQQLRRDTELLATKLGARIVVPETNLNAMH